MNHVGEERICAFFKSRMRILDLKKTCDIFFQSDGWKFIENWPYFGYKNDPNSKNKNRKIDFSFVSAHFAYFMWIWTLLKKLYFFGIFPVKYWKNCESFFFLNKQKFCFFWWGALAPTKKKCIWGLEFFFRIRGP